MTSLQVLVPYIRGVENISYDLHLVESKVRPAYFFMAKGDTTEAQLNEVALPKGYGLKTTYSPTGALMGLVYNDHIFRYISSPDELFTASGYDHEKLGQVLGYTCSAEGMTPGTKYQYSVEYYATIREQKSKYLFSFGCMTSDLTGTTLRKMFSLLQAINESLKKFDPEFEQASLVINTFN